MKKFRTLLSVAGLVILTGAAAYSTNIQNAKIPFEFRAGGAVLPAGEYQFLLDTARATPSIRLHNWDTNRGAVVMAAFPVSPDRALKGAQANLVFLCAGSDCALSEVQPGRGQNGYRLSRPKFGVELGQNRTNGPEVARVVIPITRAD